MTTAKEVHSGSVVAGDFRDRIGRGELLLGSMLKTPTTHATEILGGVGFDYLVVDQEHAPFDNSVLDQLALASHAGGIASLVRVSDDLPARILSVLDMGFAGVIVPHVSSAKQAESVVAACRYATGKRGFSGTTRAGLYGCKTMSEHIASADGSTTVIVMIEDPSAISSIEQIVAVEGVDALLIGRADLAVSMGATSSDAPEVTAAVNSVLNVCQVAGRRVMLYVNHVDEAKRFIERGASLFLVGSDQGLMQRAARSAKAAFEAIQTFHAGST